MKEASDLARTNTNLVLDLDYIIDRFSLVTPLLNNTRWLNNTKDFWTKNRLAFHNASLLHNDSIKSTINRLSLDYLNINHTLQSWRRPLHLGTTDFADFNLNTFNNKLITNSLPTGDLLALRHGGRFKIMLCSICNQHKETFEHTWLYPLNGNNIDFVISVSCTEALEEIDIHDALCI